MQPKKRKETATGLTKLTLALQTEEREETDVRMQNQHKKKRNSRRPHCRKKKELSLAYRDRYTRPKYKTAKKGGCAVQRQIYTTQIQRTGFEPAPLTRLEP